MKTKNFQDYLEKRLDKKEIAKIKKQARLEVKILKQMQQFISNAMIDYMEKNKIGFNELVRQLNASPSHIAKIQRGEANLTLSSLAHLLASIGKDPKDFLKYKQ